MNRWIITALLPALAGGIAAAVDDTRGIRDGGGPPTVAETEPIVIPKAPSQEEVKRAQDRRVRVEGPPDGQNAVNEARPSSTSSGDVSRTSKTGKKSLADAACFEPLSELLEGASGDAFMPITPSALSEKQQKKLITLFSRLEGHWQGSISNITCISETANPAYRTSSGTARTNIDWDKGESQLAIETEFASKSGKIKRFLHNFEVGKTLYFTDSDTTTPLNSRINETEILTLGKNSLSFLTKIYLKTRTGAMPRAHIRHLETRGKQLKLSELIYTRGTLSSIHTWVLIR